MADQEEGVEIAPEVLAKARSMGWSPLEKWRGDPALWRNADEFVRRGEEILPIVQATNKKLIDELAEVRKQLVDLKGANDAQSKAMKDLLEHSASEVKRQVNEKIKELQAGKRAAIKEGDHELAADLDEQIDATKEQLAQANAAKPPAPAPAPPPGPTYEPWAVEFAKENDDWLGKDKPKTGLFMGICDEINAEGLLKGADLLAEGKRRMEAQLGKGPNRASKTDSGDSGGASASGAGKGGKGYLNLPADAKAKCKEMESKFVGANKVYKTPAEWQKYYAETYFASTEN